MSKVQATVNPGICGFATKVTADCEDGQTAAVSLETECPSLAPMAEKLGEVDAFAACFGKIADSAVYQIANDYCAHTACPVPCAVVKAVEAAAGLALPADVSIAIEKLEG